MKEYPFRAVLLGVALAVILCPLAAVGAATRIVIPCLGADDTRHSYTLALLRLALDKTVDEYGEYELVFHELVAEQSRSVRLLDGGELDLYWSMTSREREEAMLPIRIPMQKGLLGYRVFIIKPHMAEAFSRVRSMEGLSAFLAGQGHDWPDREILDFNGLRVVPATTYPGCFRMLLSDRFDYFPRGVVEPWSEVAQYPAGDLVVEETLMLRYPAPIYFFVSRSNAALARRMEKGLRAALADGSFDDLFYNHPYHREAFEKARVKERRVFDLVNPLLPPETPLHEKALWIDLDKLP